MKNNTWVFSYKLKSGLSGTFYRQVEISDKEPLENILMQIIREHGDLLIPTIRVRKVS